MALKKIFWFNQPQTTNENFEDLQSQIDALTARVEALENA